VNGYVIFVVKKRVFTNVLKESTDIYVGNASLKRTFQMIKKKKKKKKPKNRQLQTKCENLWKKIIELRDGRACKVKKLYPEINLTHSNVLQADHCFTRGNKHLFLDPANGTMVCSSCNMAKHYDNKSVKRAVDMIVRRRVGENKWEEMLACDMRMGPNYNWNKIWWLEERLEILERALADLKKQGGNQLGSAFPPLNPPLNLFD